MVRVVAVFALALACSGPPRQSAQTIDGLRYQLASDPGDDRARAGLARALDRDGRIGDALSEWERLARRGVLPDLDRRRVAELFAMRASARLEREDPDAWADVLAAQRADRAAVTAELRRRAADFWVAYELRTVDKVTRLGLLSKQRARVVRAGPRRSELAGAGAVGRWLWKSGARRHGYRWLQAYIDRGGRQGAVVRDYIAAVGWWRGIDASPSLEVEERAAQAGATLCGVLADRCPDVVRAVDDAQLGHRLWIRTSGLKPTGDPLQAAGWTAVTLREWREGSSAGWLFRLAARVDLEAVAKNARLPLFAAATLLRASGNEQRSADALELAVASLETLSPGQREVVLAELAVRGDPRAEAQGYRHASLVRRVRAQSDVAELWRGLLSGAEAASGLPVHAARSLYAVRSKPPLRAILRAYRVDPARSERIASDYAGRSVLLTERRMEIAELYRSMADPGRYRRWAAAAVDQSPRDFEARYQLALAANSVGARPEAEIHLTQAAASSGDPGDIYRRAVVELVGRGDADFAVAMGRLAMSLVPRSRRQNLLGSMLRAIDMQGRLTRRVELQRLAEAVPKLAVVDDTDARSALARGDTSSLEQAAKWNPGLAEPRARLLAASPDKPGRLPGELAAIAIAGSAANARTAAEALIAYYTRTKQTAQLRAFERLLRGI